MEFDYFYKRDSERYSFYMLPKVLVKHEKFKTLSSDAKILYCCLLDRNELSSKNGWQDEQGRIYTIFTIEEITEALNKSNKTAIKIMKELENKGLIKRKRQGLGKPNITYVMDFTTGSYPECKNYTSEVKNLHARSVESTSQEVKNLHGTNTNNNNTDYNKTDFIDEPKGLGTFKNVFLSDKSIEKLKEILSNRLDNYIERLSTYIKSTGRDYEDHEAAILSWFYKDQGNKYLDKKNTSPTWDDYDKGDFL